MNVYGHGYIPFVGQWVETVYVDLDFCPIFAIPRFNAPFGKIERNPTSQRVWVSKWIGFHSVLGNFRVFCSLKTLCCVRCLGTVQPNLPDASIFYFQTQIIF